MTEQEFIDEFHSMLHDMDDRKAKGGLRVPNTAAYCARYENRFEKTPSERVKPHTLLYAIGLKKGVIGTWARDSGYGGAWVGVEGMVGARTLGYNCFFEEWEAEIANGIFLSMKC